MYILLDSAITWHGEPVSPTLHIKTILLDPKVTERDFFSPELFMEKLFGKSNLQPAGLRIRVGASSDPDPSTKTSGMPDPDTILKQPLTFLSQYLMTKNVKKDGISTLLTLSWQNLIYTDFKD